MDHQDTCRALQEELAFDADRRPLRPKLKQHLTRCANCQSFEQSVKALVQLSRWDRIEPPENLVKRAMERLAPELAARTHQGFRLRVRLAIAGLASLPIILGINGLLIWIVYSSLEGWLAQPLAAIAAYALIASTLLGLSLVYGSLPLMAEWGLELRQRCHNLATSGAVSPGLGAAAVGRSE